MAARYALTEDALSDFDDIEQYVLGYADETFLEKLEDDFLQAFDRLVSEALEHPVYQFEPPIQTLHEYRSTNVYHYKIFYYIRENDVVIYRILHIVSDFTRNHW